MPQRTTGLIMESRDHFNHGDFDETMLKLNHVLIIDPGNEEAKKILYELYLHLDKNEEALNFINEFLIKDSNNVELLFAKANCLNDLGRIDDF